ncbi:MAG: sigma-70 family RNA polymerase sigma factor [Clostridiales bacterium]|nr:sigma-70 family RNA polymerase sigma factor [Candidatus Cacconaster stercorequi]
MREERAIKELRRGSETALAWLIDIYTPYVSAIIRQIVGKAMPPSDVEEITADVFVALWNRASTLRTASVKSWLGTVARNTALNRLRTQTHDLPLEEDILLLPDTDTPEGQVEKQERTQAVREAVLAMEVPDREIFLRHYYYGQSVNTIANEMGLSVSNIKIRLMRGREKLRGRLTEGGCRECK